MQPDQTREPQTSRPEGTKKAVMNILVISLGGALGANARYAFSLWMARQTAGRTNFPWGTFFINISGSFALGLFMALSTRASWNDNGRLFFAVGFLGAFTTFSTFEYETLRLLMDGQTTQALRYLVGSVFAGLIGVALGVLAGQQRS